jgi:mono/diheme cytochrome c family protein
VRPIERRFHRSLPRTTLVVAVLVAAVSWNGTLVPRGHVQAAQAPPPAPSPDRVVGQYCVTCHNQRLKTGGLALDQLDVANVARDGEVWEKVIKKVRGNMMPPAGSPRPDAATLDAFAAGLEATLDRAATARPRPGRVRPHRFNRAEYANAIRDLLALEVDAAALLPPDDSSYGFDNIADILGVSPLLMERYVGAAERISALAVGDPSLTASSQMYRVSFDLPQHEHIEGLPMGTRGGTAVRHHFPLDGEYLIKLRLWKTSVGYVRGLQTEHDLEVSIDGRPVLQAPVGGPSDYQMNVLNSGAAEIALESRLRTRTRVSAGTHDVVATFLTLAGGVRTGPEGLKPTMFAVDPLYIHGVPAIERVIIEGPYNATGPGDTPSRRAIFTCRPTSQADELPCARSILSRLSRRAYRRATTDADLRPLLELFRRGRATGSFDAGIQLALQGVLTSPKFLFRVETDPATKTAGTTHRVNDVDLASRLSFFLWSSIPDQELLDAAAGGRLAHSAELDRQVRRMLADPRAQSLAKNFGGQWLHLRNLAAFVPTRDDFPEFDEALRQAMRSETELLLDSLRTENRSVLDLLRADYTFANERLARHYGMRGVYGTHFRRVPVTDPVRQGLLGHASILAVTSYPNRTSPVVRGKWILENVMGTPPPPPPPGAANVLADNAPGKLASVRARLAAHRTSPQCASCHRVMDPLGFALENFDAVGAWRTEDQGSPIDAADTLVDGTKVNGPVELRQALLRRPDTFVNAFTEKLLVYALGRGLDHHDMPAVRAIVRGAAGDDHRFAAIVLGIARSVPFQMREASAD